MVQNPVEAGLVHLLGRKKAQGLNRCLGCVFFSPEARTLQRGKPYLRG